ncbi:MULTISPECIES: DUF99 family protein [Halobacterium]|uniref:endonuclease dU n=1 Tax=Halobacterium TaxID=2239 RepID=UPI001962AE22|nr:MULTISPECIES: DUF99 family protein [Halobacterium]MDL0123199.1 DUF99 family protein [Halobacterium salinarum]MDL0133852.1 DUF99 family protein [Halobacterium salinarum]MDL0136627.1 DUF99 family protein [Halobacterium salinarum]QRY24364.1 DUF99 family protein [Halobacterium sp. BOL4-2]
MKRGTRALGVAVSNRGDGGHATVGGAVVRASRVVDGVSFSACTVGGLDSTAAVSRCYERLNREDVQYVLLAGIAPAWFNVIDVRAVHDRVDRPVLAVSFEESPGLDEPINREFTGRERDARLAIYGSLPERTPVTVNDHRVFVRSVGCDRAAAVVRAFTPAGGRPEPLRVARLAARAGDDYA